MRNYEGLGKMSIRLSLNLLWTQKIDERLESKKPDFVIELCWHITCSVYLHEQRYLHSS